VVCSKDQDHVAVASQDDEQGDDEPGGGPPQAVRQVLLHQVGVRGVVARLGGVPRSFIKEHIWENLDKNQHPNPCADGDGVTGPDFAHDLHRVHDAQIPVDADAGEEADAAVQVEVEAKSGHFTEGLSESPCAPLRVIADQKRQRKNIQQVRDSEVKQKYI